MTPFAREVACEDCGREYVVSGASVNPGTETEAPTRLLCACGGFLTAFVPGSVNVDTLVLTPKERTRPA